MPERAELHEGEGPDHGRGVPSDEEESSRALRAQSHLRKARQFHHELVALLHLLITKAEVLRLKQADILKPPAYS